METSFGKTSWQRVLIAIPAYSAALVQWQDWVGVRGWRLKRARHPSRYMRANEQQHDHPDSLHGHDEGCVYFGRGRDDRGSVDATGAGGEAGGKWVNVEESRQRSGQYAAKRHQQYDGGQTLRKSPGGSGQDVVGKAQSNIPAYEREAGDKDDGGQLDAHPAKHIEHRSQHQRVNKRPRVTPPPQIGSIA